MDLTVERLIPGGLGIGFADGRTIFVSLAAPGDRVRVTLQGRRGSAVFGSITEVLEPSPQRIDPGCIYFGRCGGCDFQQLSYEHQLAAKVDAIHDCLRRIGAFEYEAEIPITPSATPWHYRATAEWQVDPRAGVVGYFARDSRRIEDIASCPIIEPALDAALGQVRDSTIAHPDGARTEIRAMTGDDAVSLVPTGGEERPAELQREIAGEIFRYDPRVFFQANPSVLPAVIAEVLRGVPEPDGRPPRGLAIDLFCGIGVFTLPLARRFARVIGIESDPNAAGFAERNARAADLRNVRIRNARVESWLPPNVGHLGAAALVVLDPPRAGAEAAVPALIKLAPRRIAYVSCDPATLARDLRALVTGGYELSRVAAFDMFPQTHHVEIVAHLTYNPGPPPLEITLVGT